MIWISWTSQKI